LFFSSIMKMHGPKTKTSFQVFILIISFKGKH